MWSFLSKPEVRAGALCLLLVQTPFVRVTYNLQVEEKPFFDMEEYEQHALGILDGKRYGDDAFFRAYRMPGLPVFLVGTYALLGRQNHRAVQWVYVILPPLMLLMVRATGKRLYGELLLGNTNRWSTFL